MVIHVLKSDPVLQELEHVQVDGPGTTYLFFYNKQGYWGLEQDATDAVRIHVEEAFLEWISCSAHFNISCLPLMEHGDGLSLPLTADSSEVGPRTLPIMHQLEQPGSLTPLANWWGVYLSRMGEPWGQGKRLRKDSPAVLGQCDHAEGHQRPSALRSAEGVHPLPPQTGECQTLTDTPLQVRLPATGIGAGAAEGVGRGNGWHLRDWICRSSSRPIQGQR